MSVMIEIFGILAYFILPLLLVFGFGILYCIIVYAVLDKKMVKVTPCAIDSESVEENASTLETEASDEKLAVDVDETKTAVASPTVATGTQYEPLDNAALLKNLEDLKNMGYISESEYELKKIMLS